MDNQTLDDAHQTQPEPQGAEKRRYQCRHIRANGRRCAGRALRNEPFCYYHQSTRRPAQDPRQPRYPDADREPFSLPVLEDRAAIQLAISQVLARIAANDLDPKRAGLLLYGLQVATAALARESRAANSGARGVRGTREYERERGARANAADASDQSDEADESELDEITVDPALGPLAPVAEIVPPAPEEEAVSPVDRFLQHLRETRPPCPLCNPEPAATVPAKPTPQPATLPTLQATAEQPHATTTNYHRSHLSTTHCPLSTALASPQPSFLASRPTAQCRMQNAEWSARKRTTDKTGEPRRARPSVCRKASVERLLAAGKVPSAGGSCLRESYCRESYFAASAFSAPALSAAALSVASQVKSLPLRPKCP